MVIAVLFAAVVVGIRRAHPVDLAVQRTWLDAFTGRVLGLYVRRGDCEPRADKHADRDLAMSDSGGQE